MKKSVCLLLTAICFIFGKLDGMSAQAQEPKSVTMLMFNVAPHIFIDKNTGEVTGAIYEFINDHLAPEMGVKFLWTKTLTNIPRQLNTLETQPGYAGALMVYSPARKDVIDFTKTAYFMSQSILIVHDTNPLNEITRVEDIIQMKIGYAKDTFLTPFMRNDKIQFDLVSHTNFNEANIKKLLANRIDAVYAPDKAGLLYVAQDLDVVKQVKAVSLPEMPAPFHIVFSKGSGELVEKYNRAFDKLDGQQLYLRMLKKFLDTSLL